MWGNLTGWTISLVIVLLVGGWVYLIERRATVTPGTAFSATDAAFAPLRLPEPPRSMLPSTDAVDGAPVYRRAIELYLADRATYTDFAAAGTLDSPHASRLPAVAALVEASEYSTARLFADEPAQVVNYAHTKPPLDALDTLGRVCVDRLALLSHRRGDAAAATRYAKAGFMLGLHLARERVTHAELALGLQLLGKTAPMLAKLADEAGRAVEAAAYREFDKQRIAFAASLEPTIRIVHALDAKRVAAHAGDVFALAERSQERMWRVEAMLALGRLRHFAGAGGTAANQRAATAFLRAAAENETDVVVRTAAIAARDLTVQEHRMQ